MGNVQVGDKLAFYGDVVCLCWIGQKVLALDRKTGNVFTCESDNASLLLERPRGY